MHLIGGAAMAEPLADSEHQAPPPSPPTVEQEPLPLEQQPQKDAVKAGMSEWAYHKTGDSAHPNGNEQQMLWLLNRARVNPSQEGYWLAIMDESDVVSARSYFNVNLTVLQDEFDSYTAKPPAAFDSRLYEAARLHNLYLITEDTQSHDGQVELVQAQDFHFQYWRGNVYSYSKSAVYGHVGFNIDWGSGTDDGMQDPRGHRMGIMSIDHNYSNVGIAVTPENNAGTSVGPLVVTQNFCTALAYFPDHSNRFIVGTVWQDANNNDQYDPGEGLAGVQVMPDGGSYYAVTADSGGYAFPVETGTYDLVFSGGMLEASHSITVEVLAESVLVDYKLPPLPGNINSDEVVDLTDAMIVLRMLTGQTSGTTVELNADVDGNGYLGMPDVLYILQQVAE